MYILFAFLCARVPQPIYEIYSYILVWEKCRGAKSTCPVDKRPINEHLTDKKLSHTYIIDRVCVLIVSGFVCAWIDFFKCLFHKYL